MIAKPYLAKVSRLMKRILLGEKYTKNLSFVSIS
jgi:hypothetical protein